MSATARVEIRVPVSPTTEFALMLAVLHQSLLRNGGLDGFRLTAVIGASPQDREASLALARWLAPDIDSLIVDPQAFQEHGIHATTEQRLMAETDAAVIVLMDADMVVCGTIADICKKIAEAPSVAGVVAHAPPRLSSSEWARLYSEAGLDAPDFPYRYTGWPLMFPAPSRWFPGTAKSPPYFNYGFVVMTSDVLEAIKVEHRTCGVIIDEFLSRPPLLGNKRYRRSRMFRSQIALTLCIERAGVPHRSLGMRYNFPNDDRLEALHNTELESARVIHLLRRTQEFDKHKVYQCMDSLQEFATNSQANGALEIARRNFAEVLLQLQDKEPPVDLAPARWLW